MSLQARASVLAVASGKGGVGKTNVTVNLAVALARRGHRVAILDADFGLGNVDVLLGLTPAAHIGHLLDGSKSLDEICMRGPAGVRIMPASSGLRTLTSLSAGQRECVARAMAALSAAVDFVIIDTASGISDNVIETLLLAERVMLVTSLEPSAIVDAYATAKVMTAAAPDREIGIVVNRVRDGHDATVVFRQLDVAAGRFLGRGLRYYGFIMDDPSIREAALMQEPIVDSFPDAPASRAFRILASRIAGFSPGGGDGLHLTAVSPVSAEASRCA
jgi:flagellar biosynthesis protein FlhG